MAARVAYGGPGSLLQHTFTLLDVASLHAHELTVALRVAIQQAEKNAEPGPYLRYDLAINLHCWKERGGNA